MFFCRVCRKSRFKLHVYIKITIYNETLPLTIGFAIISPVSHPKKDGNINFSGQNISVENSYCSAVK